MIDVQLVRVRAILWRFLLTLTLQIEGEDNSVTVCRLV